MINLSRKICCSKKCDLVSLMSNTWVVKTWIRRKMIFSLIVQSLFVCLVTYISSTSISETVKWIYFKFSPQILFIRISINIKIHLRSKASYQIYLRIAIICWRLLWQTNRLSSFIIYKELHNTCVYLIRKWFIMRNRYSTLMNQETNHTVKHILLFDNKSINRYLQISLG